jgi:AbrB family looped-hinge helix DNA binding protein
LEDKEGSMTELDSLYPPFAAMISEVCSPIGGWYDAAMPRSTGSSEGPDTAIDNQVFRVIVETGGKVTLPGAVRKRLGVAEGDYLVLKLREDGSVVVVSVSQLVDQAMGSMNDVAPGRSLADELIAERREEARRENGE